MPILDLLCTNSGIIGIIIFIVILLLLGVSKETISNFILGNTFENNNQNGPSNCRDMYEIHGETTIVQNGDNNVQIFHGNN